MTERPGDTLDFILKPLSPEPMPKPATARTKVHLAGQTHQGKVRTNNQDHFLCVRFGRFFETMLTSLAKGQLPKAFEEEGFGMLVADGMGGAAAGEVASQLAIQMLINLALHTPDWILSTAGPEAVQVMERMAERFRFIDAMLVDQAEADPQLAGMGTTMTLAVNFGPSLILAYVGDSRAYLMRHGKLHQLTRDHTQAQALVDAGILRPEQAAGSRLRHVLTRALGGLGNQAEADVDRLVLEDGDQILLCTDGLTNMVSDEELRAILLRSTSLQDACANLVDAALEQGGRDNVTVTLARYEVLAS